MPNEKTDLSIKDCKPLIPPQIFQDSRMTLEMIGLWAIAYL